MADLNALYAEVSDTLKRARERTGCAPEPRAVSPAAGRQRRAGDRLRQLADAVARQRALCAQSLSLLDAKRKERQRLERSLRQHEQQCEAMAEDLEIVAKAIELTSARRRDLKLLTKNMTQERRDVAAKRTEVALGIAGARGVRNHLGQAKEAWLKSGDKA